MTAVNIVVVNGGRMAHIVTDGAVYNMVNKRPKGHLDKFKIVPRATTVVACRGNLLLTRAMTKYVDGCDSLDEMAARFPKEMRKQWFARAIGGFVRFTQRWHPLLRGLPPIAAFGVIFVGYSMAAKRIKAVAFESESDPPFRPIEDDMIIAPGGIELSKVKSLLPSQYGEADPNTWGKALLNVVNLQRDVYGEHVIGGYAMHTIVGADAVHTRLLHVWRPAGTAPSA